MRKDGEVTVFLSMVLLCLVSLMCGLIESARMAGTRYYLKTAADSAMDSVFSGYHRKAWEDYRLFLLEYREPEETARAWREFMKPYEEDHGWYPFQIESSEMQNLKGITEGGGKYLKQEILDYMQYGIWDTDTEESHAEDLLKNLKEAKAAGEISRTYGEHTKEAVRLEKALEAVEGNLEKQREEERTASRCLKDWDGSGFRRSAKGLEWEMGKLPSLVETYKKRADELAERLSATKRELSECRQELSLAVSASMEEELSAYESYVEQDGQRRGEIEGLEARESGNSSVIGEAVERSLEVEDIIDEWENSHDEEDSGPDEGSLWNSVEAVWEAITIPEPSCSFGVKDKEKEDLLERISHMADFGLLDLVVPEEIGISRAVLDMEDFPSLSGHDGAGEDPQAGLAQRLLIDEYVGKFLVNFCSEEKKPAQYEQEYLIGGKPSEQENLKEAVQSLLLIREGLNMIHILSDPEKRQEARAMAAAITGVAGLAPLSGVVAFFIMTVWALGESFFDIRSLLEGNRVPLLKTKETWNLSLDQLLETGRGGKLVKSEEEGEGLDYGAYIKLLLFAEKPETLYYRLMDVIQMNIRRTEGGFLMSRCAYFMEIKGKAAGKHLFSAGGDRHYSMEVMTDKAY